MGIDDAIAAAGAAEAVLKPVRDIMANLQPIIDTEKMLARQLAPMDALTKHLASSIVTMPGAFDKINTSLGAQLLKGIVTMPPSVTGSVGFLRAAGVELPKMSLGFEAIGGIRPGITGPTAGLVGVGKMPSMNLGFAIPAGIGSVDTSLWGHVDGFQKIMESDEEVEIAFSEIMAAAAKPGALENGRVDLRDFAQLLEFRPVLEQSLAVPVRALRHAIGLDDDGQLLETGEISGMIRRVQSPKVSVVGAVLGVTLGSVLGCAYGTTEGFVVSFTAGVAGGAAIYGYFAKHLND